MPNRLLWYLKGKFWLFVKKRGWIPPHHTMGDQSLDRMAPFDEYPACDFCGGADNSEQMVTKDGSRIVACDRCGLWFTSPRIAEDTWIDYLRSDTARSREFTENRLTYGVALGSNVKFTLPDWKEKRLAEWSKLLNSIEHRLGGPITSLHDVGAGVGLLLEAARNRGAAVSGNEMNGYACRAMRERLGLDVRDAALPDMALPPDSLDVITMCDYLEHTYHPYGDLKAAFKALRPGGVLFVNTFHIECDAFRENGNNWNFLFWNHTHHFTTGILREMIEKAGFTDIEVVSSPRDTLFSIYAKK